MNKHTPFFTVAIGLTLTFAASADVYHFRTVAKTGDPVPQVGGTFLEFGWPRINSSGQVAFAASRTADVGQTGIWLAPLDQPDAMQAIMLAGTQVPDSAPGTVFDHYTFADDGPEINDAGHIAFVASLLGLPGESPNGAFRFVNGTLTKVAATGDPAPGIGGATLARISRWCGFNESDLMAFGVELGGQGVTEDDDVAIYMHWFGGLNLVKREGNPSPPNGFGWTWGTNATGSVQNFLPLVQIADNGRIGFDSEVFTNSGSTVSRWTGWPGALSHGMLAGNLSPEFHPFVNQLGNFGVYSMHLTEDGFAFYHAVDVNGEEATGIWRYDGNSLETVAQEGAAGPLGEYKSIWPYSIVTAFDGTVAFSATFTPFDPTTDGALLIRRPNQQAVALVREGDAAPGYWPNVVFSSTMSMLAIDDSSRIYSHMHVSGPGIDATNNSGIWRMRPDGQVQLVVRKGQTITLDDGIERQVANMQVHRGSGLHTGARPGINNAGDVALWLAFTDDTSAVVVAEPTCLGDLNIDNTVDVSDLLLLLAAWGPCDACDADLDESGSVDVSDLLILLGAWGGCP